MIYSSITEKKLNALESFFFIDPRLPDQSRFDAVHHIQARQSHQVADQIGSGSKPVFASSGVGIGAIQRLNRICFCRHLWGRVFVVRSYARSLHHFFLFGDDFYDGFGHIHSSSAEGLFFRRHESNDKNDNTDDDGDDDCYDDYDNDYEDVRVYKMAVG